MPRFARGHRMVDVAKMLRRQPAARRTHAGGASACRASLDAPVLHLSVGQIVEALRQRFGAFEIDYAPVERIEQRFGRQPPLTDDRALAAGFRDDGTIDALVEAALEGEDGTLK